MPMFTHFFPSSRLTQMPRQELAWIFTPINAGKGTPIISHILFGDCHNDDRARQCNPCRTMSTRVSGQTRWIRQNNVQHRFCIRKLAG